MRQTFLILPFYVYAEDLRQYCTVGKKCGALILPAHISMVKKGGVGRILTQKRFFDSGKIWGDSDPLHSEVILCLLYQVTGTGLWCIILVEQRAVECLCPTAHLPYPRVSDRVLNRAYIYK
jgi:hypothetical protein